MKRSEKTQVAMIGCGAMAHNHIRSMLTQQATTDIRVICEPNPEAYARAKPIFAEADVNCPPNQADLPTLLSDYASQLDAVFIMTPHAYHYEQAKQCLTAGLDVLLEKPMVIQASQAIDLIKERDKTGKTLVVAFNGSLSPRIREASRLIEAGEAGRILTINAMVWESWSERYVGHWKQNRDISGGGFLFDTGSHMLNTVSDLVGEAFIDVTAWLDNRGKSVDILGSVMARTESGVLVTMTACGEAIPSIGSAIHIFGTEATIRTGIWGEFLEIQKRGEESASLVGDDLAQGVWKQFLAVRHGEIENPSPPEIGLRMAYLWDAIQESARNDGAMVRIDSLTTRQSHST